MSNEVELPDAVRREVNSAMQRSSTRPWNVIDTTHSTPPSMSSSAPDPPSQDDSVTGEHASPDLFESHFPNQPHPSPLTLA